MYNPFGLLTMKLLQALIKAGNVYFVRQTYRRGLDIFDESNRGAFLLSHYTDAVKAQVHYDAIAHDGNRFIYDANNDEQLKKLEIAAGQPQGFRVYSPLLEKEWKPSGLLSDKIRHYVSANLLWTPGRNDTVKADLFVRFGELFITLKHRMQEIQVPLSEIEKH